MNTTSLDQIDCTLLRLLQKNARYSNKELAAEVGLAPSSCLERVRRLQEGGYFQGFHAHVAPEGVGIGLQAMIAVRLQIHSHARYEAFRAHVLEREEATVMYHVAGANDFLLHVAVRDAAHLRQFVLEALTTRPEVAHVETNLVFEVHRNPVLPIYQ